MPTPKQPKKKIVKAYAEIDKDDGELLALFVEKPNYRYQSSFEDSKLVKIEISYQLPKRNKSR